MTYWRTINTYNNNYCSYVLFEQQKLNFFNDSLNIPITIFNLYRFAYLLTGNMIFTKGAN